jgi:hypothetical protein
MPIVPCTSTPIQTGIIQFLPSEFVAAYPEFTGLTNAQMTTAFNLATLALANTCRSRVFNAQLRETLLFLLTAHIAKLQYGTNDGAGNVSPPQGIVGRIDAATEGQVTVSAEMIATARNSWYLQTQYGAMYWNATARFRTAIYVAPITTGDGQWGEGFGGGFGPRGC